MSLISNPFQDIVEKRTYIKSAKSCICKFLIYQSAKEHFKKEH